MSTLLLSYSTNNLGDDIQSHAARQFLGQVNGYIDRDFLTVSALSRQSTDAFLFANGWYAHLSKALFFGEDIRPFYFSLHINRRAILDDMTVQYMRRFAPIGCRDLATLELLRSSGIEGYFSGCLTCTFPAYGGPRSGVVFCDVPRAAFRHLPPEIVEEATFVSPIFPGPVLDDLRRDRILRFVHRVASRAPKYIEAYWRRHLAKRLSVTDVQRITRRMSQADELLHSYRTARLVVTSRLHCAIPCAAFGTPFIFFLPWTNDTRFSGLEKILRPVNPFSERVRIPWDLEPVNIDGVRQVMAEICRRAVELGGNPLREPTMREFVRELATQYSKLPQPG